MPCPTALHTARGPEPRSDTSRATVNGRSSAEGGFTLVELMVSLVLTSVMFSAMLVAFQAQNTINTVELDVIETQQNARMAMTSLGTDIRQAGYYVDHFNRQPVWIDAAPNQLTFNANLSDRFVAMNRDSAVPLSDGTMYKPGDFTSLPQNENLPVFLDRYLNESETIRLTLDRTHDGLVTVDDRQPGAANPNLYTLTKEVNGNPPAILAYNVRGPAAYPDGTLPPPIFQYWGVFTLPDVLELWGDSNSDGALSQAEINALTPVSRANLPNVQRVDITVIVETGRLAHGYEGPFGTSGDPYQYRSYTLRRQIRARNVGINPSGWLLCGVPPDPPLNPFGYDTPADNGGSITIEWDSSLDEFIDEEDVQYYSVYRKLGSAGEEEVVGQIQAIIADTNYVFIDDGDVDNFNSPVDGLEYYYRMAAWDCAPQESVPTAWIGPIVSIPNGPQPPVIDDAWDTPCDTGLDITVRFLASPQDNGLAGGVERYQVYRGTVSDGTIFSKVLVDTLVDAVGQTAYEFHDTVGNDAGLPPVDNTDYYYIIRAVRAGIESENSNEAGAVWSSEGLSAARLISVVDKPGDDGRALLLAWRRSPSEDCTPGPEHYWLMRRVKGTSTWNKVGEFLAAGQQTYNHEDNNLGAGLIPGTTYEYLVLTKLGTEFEESNVEEGTPAANPLIGPPAGLSAEDEACDPNGNIILEWSASPDDGDGSFLVDQYLIYRWRGGFAPGLVAIVTADGSELYNWTDSAATNPGNAPILGVTYWYHVTAYNSSTSAESDPSNDSEATADGSPGAAEITAAFDTFQPTQREIRVEWLASEDDGGCSDSVYDYRIFRTTVQGNYTAPAIGHLHADNSELYFWLDNLSNSTNPPADGQTYWYIIRAYDIVNDLLSMASNEFGPVEPFGDACECCPIFQDDFESGNLGWTSGGNRDDWQLGRPRGKSFDPSVAHSGANVWGNDIGEGSFDGMYRSRADNWIISPTMDLSGYNNGTVMLSYWRWLSVQQGTHDDAELRIDNGSGWQTMWQNQSDVNTVDGEWKEQLLDLTPYLVLGSPNVRIAWALDTNNSQQFGGWNIDDVEVCYTSAGPCDIFLYIGDSVALNQGNNLFFDIFNTSDVPVDMLGMIIDWSVEGSLLKSIATQGSGPGEVWTTAVSQAPTVEATFSTPVTFDADGSVRFKLRYQPGQLRGSALRLRFITECGVSNEIVIQLPG